MTKIMQIIFKKKLKYTVAILWPILYILYYIFC